MTHIFLADMKMLFKFGLCYERAYTTFSFVLKGWYYTKMGNISMSYDTGMFQAKSMLMKSKLCILAQNMMNV